MNRLSVKVSAARMLWSLGVWKIVLSTTLGRMTGVTFGGSISAAC